MKFLLGAAVAMCLAISATARAQTPRAVPAQPAPATGNPAASPDPGAIQLDLNLPRGIDFVREFCETVGAPFSKEVRAALGLSSAQYAQMLAIQQRAGGEQNQWAMLEKRKLAYLQMVAELTPAQAIRYEELRLQYQGALCALLRTSVSEMLQLSDAQNREVEQLYLLYRKSMDRVASQLGSRQQSGLSNSAEMVRVRLAMDVLAEAVLTGQQKRRFDQMRGPRLQPWPKAWSNSLPLP